MANKVGGSGASIGLLTDIDTEARNPVLSTRFGDDQSEYIYLKGVASVGVGSVVTYDENGLTALVIADAVGPVAVAVAAVVASTWGWFCIKSPSAGLTTKCDVVADNTPAYIDGTAGRVDDAVVTGDLVCNMFMRSADAANLCTTQFDHPFVTNALG